MECGGQTSEPPRGSHSSVFPRGCTAVFSLFTVSDVLRRLYWCTAVLVLLCTAGGQGGRVRTVHEENPSIETADDLCGFADRAFHPHRCDAYLVCDSHGQYTVVTCPTGSGYDPLFNHCSPDYHCDVIDHVPRLHHARRRRAVEGDNTGLNDKRGYIFGSGEVGTEILGDKADTNETDSDLIKNGENIVSNTTESKPIAGKMTTTATPEQTTPPPPVAVTTARDVITTTPGEPEVADTTRALEQTTIEVVIPEKSPEPPYGFVTETPEDDITTAKNMSGNVEEITKSANVGAIVGIVIALLVIVAIIVVIVILVKKRKLKLKPKLPVKRKKKIVTKMENPQYKDGPGQTYRFSRDSSLHVGPTSTTLTKFNNPNLADTPLPAVLQHETPGGPKRAGSLPRSIASRREKRKAPAPPNPFGDEYDAAEADLYEKASQGSGEVELQTFTVKNEHADDNDNEPSYPLLKRQDKEDKAGSLENGKVKAGDPKVKDAEQTTAAAVAPSDGDGEDKALLETGERKKSSSSVDHTLDEYDMTQNPFFAKT